MKLYTLTIAAISTLGAVLVSPVAKAGLTVNALSANGLTVNGLTVNGLTVNGQSHQVINSASSQTTGLKLSTSQFSTIKVKEGRLVGVQ